MNRKKIIFFTMFLLLGFMLAFFVTTLRNNVKYVPLSDIKDLVQSVEVQKAENEKLKSTLQSLEQELTDYEDAIEQGIGIEEVLRRDIEVYRTISGLTKVGGPGVVIIISDSERDLLQDEDPNNLIVHDLDIVALIEDLKYAGAEAVAVNGQRVIFNVTEIYCTGPTIKINDKIYAQPFVIEAIGDKTFLEAAVTAPETYGSILKQWGLFMEVNSSVYVEVPAYEGSGNFKYLKAKE